VRTPRRHMLENSMTEIVEIVWFFSCQSWNQSLVIMWHWVFVAIVRIRCGIWRIPTKNGHADQINLNFIIRLISGPRGTYYESIAAKVWLILTGLCRINLVVAFAHFLIYESSQWPELQSKTGFMLYERY
jgi:hypothetical protein